MPAAVAVEAVGKPLPRGSIAREQAACRPWLEAELERIRPEVIVCLGSMAAAAIFGSRFRLLAERGQWRQLEHGARAFATVHPSYLLRLPDAAARLRGVRARPAPADRLMRAGAGANGSRARPAPTTP